MDVAPKALNGIGLEIFGRGSAKSTLAPITHFTSMFVLLKEQQL